MIKTQIKKNGTESNLGYHDTQEQADSWLAQEIANGSFGKVERHLFDYELESHGELAENASSQEEKTYKLLGEEEKIGILYTFPADFTVETVDMSAEIFAAKKRKNKKKMMAFGEDLIVDISMLNESKMVSYEQVEAVMSNATLSLLREHLWAGNIPSFINKLQTTDVTAFFDNAEKSSILQKCNEFLSSLEV